MILETVPPTCGNTDSSSRYTFVPGTVVRDNVEFPIKSISMPNGTVTASITKSNQDHPEKGQSSPWTIIKVFTHIPSDLLDRHIVLLASRSSDPMCEEDLIE